MNNDALKAAAPSIFARRPSKRVGDNYGFIPTMDIVKAVRDAGFVPAQAAGQRSYKGGDNHLFGRHMIRFQPVGALDKVRVGDVIPQVVMYNSHNGRTLYRFMAGLFRLICSNGMIVSYGSFGQIIVRHSKDALVQVVAAMPQVLEQATESTKVIAQMRHMLLTDKQQNDFAHRALKLRYGKEAPIKADALLVAKREEDEGRDLWRVFNRVQENTVRGGMAGQAATGRRLTVRPLTNIRRDVGVNVDLWSMTMDWMRKHGVQPRIG